MCNRLPEIMKNGDAGIFPVYYSLNSFDCKNKTFTIGLIRSLNPRDYELSVVFVKNSS